MSAQPIQWHVNCLKNMQATRQATLLKLESIREEAYRQNQRVYILQAQLDRAIKERRTHFDADKFNLPRRPKP